MVLLTLGGMAALWPSSETPRLSQALRSERSDARILQVARQPCSRPQGVACRQLVVRLAAGGGGPAAGSTQTLPVGEDGADPGRLEPGDRIVVLQDRELRSGQPSGRYYLADTGRAGIVLWLTLAFAVVVVALGRRRGVLALVGLGVSLLVITRFIVPATLDGRSPLGVAVVGALAVMLATIGLAHGVGVKSLASMTGTAASLLLTVALALIFTEAASLTGFASEEARAVRTVDLDLSLQGLVLAGIVIAALGVLDDVTVSQAATVLALRRADPTQGARALYREAIDVGRDHLTATVNTLVLAYAGASLPLLLYFSVDGVGLLEALDREVVAQQAIGTLVGSVGLVAAVPLTTALAALLAVRLAPEQIPEDDHGHAH